jgi:voltage-gated sodium channel
MFVHSPDAPAWKHKVENFINRPAIQHFIVFLIVLNAALLGLETNAEIVEAYGRELVFIDHGILMIFTLEIVLLMASRGGKFFHDPWCVFDFIVIGISFVPATESLSVLRSLRVLRVLRLINKVESMRKVVAGLLSSLPGLGSVVSLILIIFYVSAVIATNVFGSAFPDLFGTLGNTFFTLFQVMTLESWSDGIARPVMEHFPYAWVFFVFFILIATFVVVNLFIAVIVDSLTSDPEEKLGIQTHHHQTVRVEEEIAALRQELQELKVLLIQSAKDKA